MLVSDADIGVGRDSGGGTLPQSILMGLAAVNVKVEGGWLQGSGPMLIERIYKFVASKVTGARGGWLECAWSIVFGWGVKAGTVMHLVRLPPM